MSCFALLMYAAYVLKFLQFQCVTQCSYSCVKETLVASTVIVWGRNGYFIASWKKKKISLSRVESVVAIFGFTFFSLPTKGDMHHKCYEPSLR